MRGLSLTQPWATLVAVGAKRIETRSWSTSYRGTVFIHAAKGFPRDCQSLCYEQPFRSVLIASGFNHVGELPRGAVVAIAGIDEVFSTNEVDPRLRIPRSLYELPHEREFGDYSDDRFGWVFRDVEKLATPVPWKGALGLWSVPRELADLVRRQAVAV